MPLWRKYKPLWKQSKPLSSKSRPLCSKSSPCTANPNPCAANLSKSWWPSRPFCSNWGLSRQVPPDVGTMSLAVGSHSLDGITLPALLPCSHSPPRCPRLPGQTPVCRDRPQFAGTDPRLPRDASVGAYFGAAGMYFSSTGAYFSSVF